MLGRLARGGDPVLRHDRPRRRAPEPKITTAGFLMLDAPVSGGQAGAHAGSMTVMASVRCGVRQGAAGFDAILGQGLAARGNGGDRQHGEDGEPVVAVCTSQPWPRRWRWALRAGADPRTLFEVISSSAGSSWMWQNRVPHIPAGDDTPCRR
jgi:3-hydroxyisobutyrate dehydrogenase